MLVIKGGVNISDFSLCIDLFICYGPSLDLALEIQAYRADYKPLVSWYISIYLVLE